MSDKAALVCTECQSRNYEVKKDKTRGQRFEVMKYCNKCKKHTLHKESK